jgi:hypothetical protein
LSSTKTPFTCPHLFEDSLAFGSRADGDPAIKAESCDRDSSLGRLGVGPGRHERGVSRIRPTRSIRDAKRYLSFRSSYRAKRENPRRRKRRVNVICAALAAHHRGESGQERPVLPLLGFAECSPCTFCAHRHACLSMKPVAGPLRRTRLRRYS